jgi:hypothetical protein
VFVGLLVTAALAATTPAPPQGTCPLTLPNGRTPPGERWAGMNHGNGKLFTAFWPYNLVIATRDLVGGDGSIAVKWPWWRGVRGDLEITGRRLDGRAPPLVLHASSDGYGKSGFLPTGIPFPTEGCWEVTGAVGNAKLTFVTLVVKASSYSLVARF